MVRVCLVYYGICNLYIWKGTTTAENYIEVYLFMFMLRHLQLSMAYKYSEFT